MPRPIKTIDPEAREALLDRLHELQSVVNSQFPEEMTFLKGTTGLWPADRIIRTGSLSLDMAIGIGGYPRGRIIEMFGQESSGKTTAALHAVRSAQQSGLPAAYIDAENALDPNYMIKLGIDPELVLISQPPNLETAINVINILMETGSAGLIVLDSVAAMKAKVVMEGDADTETRAVEARRWAAQLPKIAKNCRETNTTLIMLNQMREGQDIWTPFTTPGGTAIKFNASLRILLKRKVEGKKNDGIDYQMVNADVIKNKVGSPFRKASWKLRPPAPIDWVEDTLSEAKSCGIVFNGGKYDPDNGQPYTKNTWFSYKLEKGDLDAIQQDDPNFQLNETGSEFLVGTNLDGSEFVSIEVRYEKKFDDFIGQWPSLIESIENQVLKALDHPEEEVDEHYGGISEDGSAAIINDVTEDLEENEDDE